MLDHTNYARARWVPMDIARGDTLDHLLDERRRDALYEPPVGRLLREGVGLSQDELARLLSVDRATISRWESGKRRPRRSHAAAYVDLLKRLSAELDI